MIRETHEPGEPFKYWRNNRLIAHMDDEFLYGIVDGKAVVIEPAMSNREVPDAIRHYEEEQGITL